VNKKALCGILETGCVGHQMAHEDRFLEALYVKRVHRFLGEMFPNRPLGSIAGSEGTLAQEFEVSLYRPFVAPASSVVECARRVLEAAPQVRIVPRDHERAGLLSDPPQLGARAYQVR
jgi:hypothetical protein